MDRLFVSGSETLVGANLAHVASQQVEVVGVPLAAPAWATGQQHSAQTAQLTRRMLQLRPTWVVHCGALATPSWDLGGAPDDWEHEEERVARLVRAARQAGSRLALVVTDAVFGGERMFHAEDERPDAPTARARAARSIEEFALGQQALVLRTLPFGWAAGDEPSHFAQRIWEALHDGPIYHAAADRFGTPLLATDLAALVLQALRADLRGLYHLGGAERVSPLEFAKALAAAQGLAWPADAFPAPPAPAQPTSASDTSLHTGRVRRDLRASLPSLAESLTRFAAQARQGHRQRLLTWCESDCATVSG